MTISPELRHAHSWLNGDGDKIRYENVLNTPTIPNASKYKIGTITLPWTTGQFSVTWVWFTPKLIRIVATGWPSKQYIHSIGETDTTTTYCMTMYYNGSFVTTITPNILELTISTSTTQVSFVSVNSDGFTLNLTQNTMNPNAIRYTK